MKRNTFHGKYFQQAYTTVMFSYSIGGIFSSLFVFWQSRNETHDIKDVNFFYIDPFRDIKFNRRDASFETEGSSSKVKSSKSEICSVKIDIILFIESSGNESKHNWINFKQWITSSWSCRYLHINSNKFGWNFLIKLCIKS